MPSSSPLLQASLRGKVRQVTGYLRAAISNPKGFRKAVRNVLTRRARIRELLRQAGQNAELPPLTVALDAKDMAARLPAALAAHFPILELDKRADLLHLGVADADLLPILRWLKSSYPQLPPGPSGTASRRKILQSPVIRIDVPGPRRQGPFELRIEPYSFTTRNRWISGNPRNRIMRSCYGDEFAAPGLRRAEDILGAPLLSRQCAVRPVDAVFTWVDHEDPDWQALYRAYRPEAETAAATAGDAASGTRFHNNDELRYALRSIWRNLPWINHVHVLSNCPPPAWLDPGHERISWVRHEEIIPARFLPTFNSHVIESFLHHLPELTGTFIYLNDDFLVMRPKRPDAFFSLAGQSVARLEGYGMVAGLVRAEDPDYLNAARNSQALLRDTLGFAATQLHGHVPYALIGPVMAEIEARFAGPIEAFRGNRFRAPGDLNIASFLYHHYALATGRALPAASSEVLVQCQDFGWRDRLATADRREHDFVCINEGGAEPPPAGWHAEIRRHMTRWFPQPAPWERS